ncbi:hypothetical protein TeGR_g7580, partial [Tetraparma gracilis]
MSTSPASFQALGSVVSTHLSSRDPSRPPVHEMLFSPATRREIEAARLRVSAAEQAERALEEREREEGERSVRESLAKRRRAFERTQGDSPFADAPADRSVHFAELPSTDADQSLDQSSCMDSGDDESPTAASLASAKKAVSAAGAGLAQRLQAAATSRKIFLSRRRNSIKQHEEQAAGELVLPRERGGANPGWGAGKQRARATAPAAPAAPAPRAFSVPGAAAPKPNPGFKALPLPKSTSLSGHGGQYGVPKVNKRKSTTPVSPTIGQAKRRASMGQAPPPAQRPRPAAKKPAPKAPASAAAPRPRPAPAAKRAPP